MASIPFVLSARTSGTGAITVTAPAGRSVGHLLLGFVETANQSVTTPANWSVVTTSPQGTGTAGGTSATCISVFYRVADGTSADDMAVADSGDHQVAITVAVPVADATTPFDATPTGSVASSATTSVSFDSITTATANALIVLAVANATDTATSQGGTLTNAALTDITPVVGCTDATFSGNNTDGNGGGLSIWLARKATAGSTGTSSTTLATSSVQGRMTIAIRPKTTDRIAVSKAVAYAVSGPSEVGVSLTKMVAYAVTEIGAAPPSTNNGNFFVFL